MHKNNFIMMAIFCVIAQLVLFIPFYLEWRKDCKILGKENLAVSLKERFYAWLFVCPLWMLPVLCSAE